MPVNSSTALTNVSWQRDGQLLQDGEDYRINEIGISSTFVVTLTVFNTTFNDSGSYTLSVTNDNGTSTATFDLVVSGKVVGCWSVVCSDVLCKSRNKGCNVYAEIKKTESIMHNDCLHEREFHY